MRHAGAIVFAVTGVFAAVMNGTAADAADPCALLTPAQVATAIGVPEVKTSTGAKRCGWVPKKYAGSKQVYIQLEDEKLFAAVKMRPVGVTLVTGIGDEAVQVTTPSSNTTILQVRKGHVVFAVSVMGLPVDQAKTAEQTLAKYAVAKL
jgi:hypothetical protein